jgi:transcriptional regulator with XRE-family HTH domain
MRGCRRSFRKEEAATALGLSQGFLSRLETGMREPTVDVIEKMAELYGVPEEYFFAALPPEAVAGRTPKSSLDLSIREQIMFWIHLQPPGCGRSRPTT